MSGGYSSRELARREQARREWQRRQRTDAWRYRFDPARYIEEKLHWHPWDGTEDAPGQRQILDAYALALQQQHERDAFEQGELSEAELTCWQPGGTIRNWIRVEAGHTVGKCVAASEWITLADGQRRRAGDLIGQRFQLLTLKDGQIISVEARAEFNAIETVYMLETDTGKQIVRNAAHPIFASPGKFQLGRRPMIAEGGFRPIAKLKAGDLVAVAEELPAFSRCERSDDEIKVMAYLWGDGGYTKNLISFSQSDNAQLAEFKECVDRLGGHVKQISKYDWMITGKGGRHAQYNPVLNLLRETGMANTHSRDKRIPECIFQGSREQITLFLNRLFATDGWASLRPFGGEIGFCSASRGLIEDLQYLLQRVGVHGRIYSKPKVNAWTLGITNICDVGKFCDAVGIFGKDRAVNAVAIAVRGSIETKARNIASRPNRPRWCYKNAPSGTRWEKVKNVTALPSAQPTVAIEVPETETFLTAFYEHNTKLAAGIVSHFFDNFPGSITYTYAPTWEQIKRLLWKEIASDRGGKGLPGTLLETCILKDSDTHFAIGKAAQPGKTEAVQGQHGPFNLHILDEAEGVADVVFDALPSMVSGGISIVLLLANPRTRTSRFHKLKAQANVVSFRMSCLNHPNVVGGREIVPGAVRRQYVEAMLDTHADVVDAHDADEHTFTVPWQPDVIYRPDAEFMFRVLGIAPANLSDRCLIPVGRYEAACKRQPTPDRPEFASAGLDCARWGLDVGTLYCRHNGAVWREKELRQAETGDYYFAVRELAKELKARGVTRFHLRVDAGGGFGGGVTDLARRDTELRAWFSDFRVFEVHFGATGVAVHDQESWRDVITELTADTAESLKGLAILNPPAALEQDLCERETEPANVQGRFVKKLEEKDRFRKRFGRSPDDGDGFVLACASEFLFRERGGRITIEPFRI